MMKRRQAAPVEVRSLLAAIMLWGAIVRLAPADDAAPTWETDVRPILKAHCTHCHGEEEQVEGGVDLRLRRFLDREAEGYGPLLVPGNVNDGELLRVIRSGEMPKAGKKVSPEELAIIERWIAVGARAIDPEPESIPPGPYVTASERDWWSFRPIVKPAVPTVAEAVRTPIDAFVLAALASKGLTLAPEADRPTLIRRLTLDLTGLLPTPEEVDAFDADTSGDAYERVVERLLASPAYAERQARAWLDVVGYSDSNGFSEADSLRPHAWRYRDWVVKSFQDDIPWDRFIQEQLAGDELAGVTQGATDAAVNDPMRRDQLIATAFLRLAPDGTGDTVPDQNLARNQVIAEQIKVTTSSLMGLSVACAQCHDHRYDPVSQIDYFRLRAIFDPVFDWEQWRPPAARLYSLYTPEERAAAAAIEAEAAKIDAEADAMRKVFLDEIFEKEIVKLPEEVRDAFRTARATPEGERSEEQKALIRKYPAALATYSLDLYDPAKEKQVNDKRAEGTKLRGTKPAEGFLMAAVEVKGRVPETKLFHRGDHEQPKQSVTPGEISVLAGEGIEPLVPAETLAGSSGRRLAYARWLTSGRHPLVARVLVNRFWLGHFGRGLVATPGDFGRLGERPSHPELLDFLAATFMEGGWKLKSLHRLIVSSAVYRQGSGNEPARVADPDNRLLGRSSPRRLDAESFRDAVLGASGRLVPTVGGPPVGIAKDPVGRIVVGREEKDANGDVVRVVSLGADDFRRSLYLQSRRSEPVTVLETFDQPEMKPNCELRRATTVAPQALLMLNDTFVLTSARALAERVRAEAPGDVRGQVSRAWRLLFSRAPSAGDLEVALAHLAEQGEAFRVRLAAVPPPPAKEGESAPAPPDPQLEALSSLCQVLLASNRFLYCD